MKKILLVIGFATYSIFGFSQLKNFEFKKHTEPFDEDYPLLIVRDGLKGGDNEIQLVIKNKRLVPKLWSDPNFPGEERFMDKHCLNSLTSDGKILYGLSHMPGGIIYKFNPQNLETIGKIEFKLPKLSSPFINGECDPNGLTYDGKYFWVGWANMKKIYKIDPLSGSVIDSIQGPPIENENQWYGGLHFYGGYFWIIRNDINNVTSYGKKDPYRRYSNTTGPILFKLSKKGKILGKWKIPYYLVSGLHIKSGLIYFTQSCHRLGVARFTQMNFNDLIKNKKEIRVREYSSEEIQDKPFTITSVKDDFFFNTGAGARGGDLYKAEWELLNYKPHPYHNSMVVESKKIKFIKYD